MRAWRVGIIGGGPGGLMTAYLLQKMADCPLEMTLFEASTRLGGKIITPHFRTSAVRYEAGAAEFYDYSLFDDDSLRDLISELGLHVTPMGGSGVFMGQQLLSNLDDVRDHLGGSACRALQAFDRVAKDRVTPAEFYHSDHPEGAYQEPDRHRFEALLNQVSEPNTRRYIEHLIS